MKVSDYIVNYFVEKNICDFFGYQGTMIAHFVDSIGKNDKAKNHVCYNEQGASFAACGYSSSTGKCAVAYATSGPGALNLVSGIANAYYDSIPVVFITGQINTYERYEDNEDLRQDAFQETKTVDICRPITKYAVEIRDPNQIPAALEKAYELATTGRKGPVLLDLPMNIQRAEIEVPALTQKEQQTNSQSINAIDVLEQALASSARPVLMLGNGIDRKHRASFLRFAETLNIPIVTSLMGKDILPHDHSLNFGYIGGAYGNRYANLIVAAKADQIIAIGCSLCTRQTGTKVQEFAPNAKVLRFDIDPNELKRKIKPDEIGILIDSSDLAQTLDDNQNRWKDWPKVSNQWLDFCSRYKNFCESFDDSVTYSLPNHVIEAINPHIDENDIVACDVGQHMMWIGQSLQSKKELTIMFSGAHGAMGYALPAAIGAGVAHPNKTVYCFCGDGAFQMNIQELQWLKNEDLNVVVFVFNNNSLGLITQQQDSLFDGNYHGAASPDFSSPNFTEVAKAYGIDAVRIDQIEQIDSVLQQCKKGHPLLIEFVFNEPTKAYPKTNFGNPIYNQEPAMPQDILDRFMNEEV